MNRSGYLTRRLDHIDRSIIAALFENGRRAIKEVAALLDMATPSITARIDKLKDAGAITGYTVMVDPGAFGLNVAAFVRMDAMPGQMNKLVQMVKDTPEIVEAFHITGKECLQAKIVVCDLQTLEIVVDRFGSCASTETSVIQSVTVAQRLPRL
jgi:Lrp/AsnC family transcriptional regulator, leucine-responsive regulatory protein